MSGMFNIATTGMLSQTKKLDVISNNIANSSTLAFKSQWVLFSEEFVSQGRQTSNGNIIQGGAGVSVSSVNSNWSVGSVQVTNELSHVMIAGDGFIPVSYNNEIYYTRAGDFSLVEDKDVPGTYILMRPNGAVLVGFPDSSFNAAPDPANYVRFQSSDYPVTQLAPTSFEISPKGLISAKPDSTSTPYVAVVNYQLGVQRFNNQNSLSKSEGGLYRPTGATSFATDYPVRPGDSGTGKLTQGALEQSNTDLIVEFTEMIQAQRAFQANSKSITTADEMFQTIMGMKR